MKMSAPPDRDASTASTVLTDLAEIISSGPDVRDVQALVVEKALTALRGSGGSVMMPSPDGMRVVAAIGVPGLEGAEPPESPVAEWVVQHDEPVLLLGRSGPLAHLLQREDIRDAVCVPLRYAGEPIGALSVSNSRERAPFNEGDVALLTTIGHLAAVALRNTQFYDEALEHRKRTQALLRRLWSAQEDERRSLAADLHDGPAQSLFHIVFRLQTARKRGENDPAASMADLEQAEQAARDTLAQVRAIMAGLRPMSLDDLGLVPALRSECSAVTSRGRVAVDVHVTGTPRRLGAEMESGLFRLAREVISNVERHSESDRARLDVRFGRTALTISMEDWGRGFDRDEAIAARRAGRIGLAAVQERAEALGVALDVASRVGHGTRVTLRCPCE